MIHNPVLPGFHPDPSIVRVGADYYIATSTFEWLPGVPLHHSTDLVNWRLIGHALTAPSLPDLRGVADSAGVWAPSLSYHDGQYWLVYTVVRSVGGAYKDLDNYVITAPDILGPWSEPVFLNSSGFDPSLFHDDDGRQWLVNMEWDFRAGHPSFAGIVVQEYDHSQRRLVGEPRTIAQADELIEGPNLYRHGQWYYLMLAEGGTGWNHGIRMARSRAIEGPYELDPAGAVLTSRDDPGVELQKAGHGELVPTPSGEWFLAHLASRAVGTPDGPRCILGRETCLQRVHWTDDGWLRLAHGGVHPRVEVPAPREHPAQVCPVPAERDDFDSADLDPAWASLRVPADPSWLSLTERPGWLRLRGRHSPQSLFDQSLIAKRLRTLRWEAQTCLDFSPEHYTQMAGLICWYDTSTYYYLRVTHLDGPGRVLGIVLNDDGRYQEITDDQVELTGWERIWLRVRVNGADLRFAASPDGLSWQDVGPVLDATKLSDDYGTRLRFTGALVGLCAQDLRGTRAIADFDYFTLRDTMRDEPA